MDSSSEVATRCAELEREAPIAARGTWMRTRFKGAAVVFLCGTIGAEFDAWQRRLSVTSAADALLSQQIGLDAVEKVMDELENEVKVKVEEEGKREGGRGKRLMPRRSPGYGDLPLALSRTILAELDAPRKIGVSITDSDLLVPSKSVTAICEIC